jgi:hypothetical protein
MTPAALLALLKKLEWCREDHHGLLRCPICDRLQYNEFIDDSGHTDDCPLARAIRDLEALRQ